MTNENVQIVDTLTEDPIRKYNHDSIIYNFFHSHDRDHYKNSGNVYYHKDRLHSYGDHFILALRLNNGQFIINADTYSSSTSGHTNMCISNAPLGTPQIPFSALAQALTAHIYYWEGTREIQKIIILDKTDDKWETVKRKDKKTGEMVEAHVHHLGASLIQYEDRFFISAIDGSSRNNAYFLTELSTPTKTVAKAYRQLSGLNDREYELYLAGTIKRQGEYFFHPIGSSNELKQRLGYKNQKLNVIKNADIADVVFPGSKPIPNHNTHIATEFVRDLLGGFFARGTIRHRQHKMLSLGNIWHKITINTQVNSWQADGGVD